MTFQEEPSIAIVITPDATSLSINLTSMRFLLLLLTITSSANAANKANSPPPSLVPRRSFVSLHKKQLKKAPTASDVFAPDEVTNDYLKKSSEILQHRGGTMTQETGGLPSAVKLLIGAGGIYAAFLYYGSLQEDVFRYTAADGTQFKQAWFLQVLEALANVVIGFVGMQLTGATKGIPKKAFAISGASQVTAKACMSLALANGLSFPLATLAKSGKMAPVMFGSLLLGGASYSLREYLQVAAIIGGTAIVSMGKKKGGSSSMLGVAYIVMSLVLDGVTAGFQKQLKSETAKAGVKPKPYDFMFWTNFYMAITAVVISVGLNEIGSGLAFCTANPEIFSKIVKFALCSAVGQSFIFYTISNFDPLVLSTVTTTRKIFSVILSIVLKGHALSLTGWSGIALACSGIVSELIASSKGKGKTH